VKLDVEKYSVKEEESGIGGGHQQQQQQQQQRDRDRDRDRDSGKTFSDDFLLGENILNDSEKSKPLPSFQK